VTKDRWAKASPSWFSIE